MSAAADLGYRYGMLKCAQSSAYKPPPIAEMKPNAYQFTTTARKEMPKGYLPKALDKAREYQAANPNIKFYTDISDKALDAPRAVHVLRPDARHHGEHDLSGTRNSYLRPELLAALPAPKAPGAVRTPEAEEAYRKHLVDSGARAEKRWTERTTPTMADSRAQFVRNIGDTARGLFGSGGSAAAAISPLPIRPVLGTMLAGVEAGALLSEMNHGIAKRGPQGYYTGPPSAVREKAMADEQRADDERDDALRLALQQARAADAADQSAYRSAQRAHADAQDVLVHELAHGRQPKRQGWWRSTIPWALPGNADSERSKHIIEQEAALVDEKARYFRETGEVLDTVEKARAWLKERQENQDAGFYLHDLLRMKPKPGQQDPLEWAAERLPGLVRNAPRGRVTTT